jgi:hypothetical protein
MDIFKFGNLAKNLAELNAPLIYGSNRAALENIQESVLLMASFFLEDELNSSFKADYIHVYATILSHLYQAMRNESYPQNDQALAMLAKCSQITTSNYRQLLVSILQPSKQALKENDEPLPEISLKDWINQLQKQIQIPVQLTIHPLQTQQSPP